MDKSYSLADVALMTGITQRTLRKHVASGTLVGEKVAGRWRYAPEEVGRFMNRPEIRKLSARHRRAMADDFLNNRHKAAPSMLCVLDMPDAPETFLQNLLAACRDVEMRYEQDGTTGMTRVTLIGLPEAVQRVLKEL